MELTQKRIGTGGSLKKLLATRQGTFAVALVACVVAAGIILLALNRYRQSVDAANAQQTVLVASSFIQKGTSGASLAAEGMYSPTKVVQKKLTPGALTDAATLNGSVAVTNILPGQQLTAADFAPRAGLASQLASAQRALAIPLDSSHGLTGVVQGGDHVDIYSEVNAAAGGTQVRLLISNVLVLQESGVSANGAVAGNNGNVVVAINTNQAAELAYASDNGKIWLVLRPGNAKNPTQTTANLGTILTSPPANGTGGGR